MYFFNVTASLFNRLIEGIKAVMNAISPIIGSISIVFVVIITIGLISSKSKKKYINENFVLIISLLCIEGIISILCFNRVVIKINLLVLVVCLMILVFKSKSKKRIIKKIKIEEEK